MADRAANFITQLLSEFYIELGDNVQKNTRLSTSNDTSR